MEDRQFEDLLVLKLAEANSRIAYLEKRLAEYHVNTGYAMPEQDLVDYRVCPDFIEELCRQSPCADCNLRSASVKAGA